MCETALHLTGIVNPGLNARWPMPPGIDERMEVLLSIRTIGSKYAKFHNYAVEGGAELRNEDRGFDFLRSAR